MSEPLCRRVELISDDVDIAIIKGQVGRDEAAVQEATRRAQWESEHVVVDCSYCGRSISSEGLLEVRAGHDVLADPLAPNVGRELVALHRYGGCRTGKEGRRVIEASAYFYAGVNAAIATALVELVAAGGPRISIARQVVGLGALHEAPIEGGRKPRRRSER